MMLQMEDRLQKHDVKRPYHDCLRTGGRDRTVVSNKGLLPATTSRSAPMKSAIWALGVGGRALCNSNWNKIRLNVAGGESKPNKSRKQRFDFRRGNYIKMRQLAKNTPKMNAPESNKPASSLEAV